MTSLIIGLTGGIGSGKTTVAKLFAALSVPVIDADDIGRELSQPGHPPFDQIIKTFGTEILSVDGMINRAALRDIVFDQPEQLAQLEAILHPAIFAEMRAQAASSEAPYCLFDIPVLFEAEQTEVVDRVLLIHAPLERRQAWIKARNSWSDTTIAQVMNAQIAPSEALKRADDVIYNDGDLADLKPQVHLLHQRYTEIVADIKQ